MSNNGHEPRAAVRALTVAQRFPHATAEARAAIEAGERRAEVDELIGFIETRAARAARIVRIFRAEGCGISERQYRNALAYIATGSPRPRSNANEHR